MAILEARDYPEFQQVYTTTARDFILAYVGEENPITIGYIQTMGYNQVRNIIPRYELGMEEVSYLAPGTIEGSSNTLVVERFFVLRDALQRATSGLGGYSQGNRKETMVPDSLLLYNVPFNIAIMVSREPGGTKFPFRVFNECWISSYGMTATVDSGKFSPVLEKLTIMYTYITSGFRTGSQAGTQVTPSSNLVAE